MGREVGGLSARVREAFCDEISSRCLVRECEELEEALTTTHTGSILRGEAVDTREMKEEIRQKDRQQSFSRCDEKSPLIAQVAGEGDWGRLWDGCLSLGEKYTTGLKKLSRLMSHHGRGQHPCPLCENPQPQTTSSVLEHIVDQHREDLNLDGGCTVEVMMRRLIELNISFLP